MADVRVYPRLPMRVARAQLAQMSGLAIDELTSRACADHPDAIFAATGGRRVTPAELQSLRERVLELARAEGFPAHARQEAAASFDVIVGVELAKIPIAGGEASRDDVWAFITLVLMPDVACWRFPDRNERRLLGGVRNAFQRTWWRAHVLRDDEADDPWHLMRLPEDALVGLMERPGISSNAPVAMRIARAIERLAVTAPSGAREDAWRNAYRRIRQRFPIVNFDWLPTSNLEHLLDDIADEVLSDLPRAETAATAA